MKTVLIAALLAAFGGAMAWFSSLGAASKPVENLTEQEKEQMRDPMNRTMNLPITDGETDYDVQKTEAEWRTLLDEEEYRVLREAGTERAFTGEYWNHKEHGVYVSKATGEVLFLSDFKFDSGCGWPSFFASVPGRIEYRDDFAYGMHRIEVREKATGSHLGHVFPDGPKEQGGLRYCINSVAIQFKTWDDLPETERETVRKLVEEMRAKADADGKS